MIIYIPLLDRGRRGQSKKASAFDVSLQASSHLGRRLPPWQYSSWPACPAVVRVGHHAYCAHRRTPQGDVQRQTRWNAWMEWARKGNSCHETRTRTPWHMSCIRHEICHTDAETAASRASGFLLHHRSAARLPFSFLASCPQALATQGTLHLSSHFLPYRPASSQRMT